MKIYNEKIILNKKLTKTSHLLKIKIQSDFCCKPGQFINILVDNNYEIFLRRPFSIFNYKNKILTILYKVIGKGTLKLSNKKIGEKINFLGPLGNSYLDFLTKDILLKNEIILVAGGTGIASLYFFCNWLKQHNIKFTLLYGAKNKDEIIPNYYFKNFKTIFLTDDGSYGRKGFVTDVLKNFNQKDKVIFTCGPIPMLKSLQKLNYKYAFASFEAYMGCGFGVCLSCAIPLKKEIDFEYLRVCKDGPIFDLNKIIFSEEK